MATTETIVIKGDNLTADLVLWRKYRRATPGLTEQVYDLNPGLSASGPFLPVGASVIFPVEPLSDQPKVVEAIRLWD